MAQGVNRNPGTAKRRLLAWLAPAALLLAGCSGGKGDITGEVTYKGEPLPYGRISFVSEVGRHDAFHADIIRGKYTIQGCPAGPVKISIESLKPPTKQELEKAKNTGLGEGGGQTISPELLKALTEDPPLKYVKIPPKYAKPETSELTYTVEKGSQTYNIPLKEK
ncbi:MAG: hypothetical protein HYS12_08210 [Planctomycetes bacterium]|nr:hypothetical protein [Planctomycetota bacterium]